MNIVKVLEIPLTKGRTAIADVNDLEILRGESWCVSIANGRHEYAMSGKSVPMQNLIMEPPNGMVVDHINHNTLDNRRCNLRVVSQAANVMNCRREKSVDAITGVTYKETPKRPSPWNAQIKVNGKSISLGWYETEAAIARLAAEKVIYRAEELKVELSNIEAERWELLKAIGSACDHLRGDHHPVRSALDILLDAEKTYLDEYDGGEE
jgi:hypothetical protein